MRWLALALGLLLAPSAQAAINIMPDPHFVSIPFQAAQTIRLGSAVPLTINRTDAGIAFSVRNTLDTVDSLTVSDTGAVVTVPGTFTSSVAAGATVGFTLTNTNSPNTLLNIVNGVTTKFSFLTSNGVNLPRLNIVGPSGVLTLGFDTSDGLPKFRSNVSGGAQIQCDHASGAIALWPNGLGAGLAVSGSTTQRTIASDVAAGANVGLNLQATNDPNTWLQLTTGSTVRLAFIRNYGTSPSTLLINGAGATSDAILGFARNSATVPELWFGVPGAANGHLTGSAAGDFVIRNDATGTLIYGKSGVISHTLDGTNKRLRVGDATAPVTTLDVAGTFQATGSSGFVTRYGNVATAARGQGAIYGGGSALAQTGAVATVATYTNGAADGLFRVDVFLDMISWTTPASFNIRVTYTDDNGTARTQLVPVTQEAGTAATAVTATGIWQGSARLSADASTAITVDTNGTFTGSPTYNVYATIEQLKNE